MTHSPDPDKLRALAEAATPGPWENSSGFVRSPVRGNTYEMEGLTVSTSCKWVAECRDGEAFYDWEANAAYIAAANPTAILALLARLESAEGALRPFSEAIKCARMAHGEGDFTQRHDLQMRAYPLPSHFGAASAHFLKHEGGE